MRTHLTSYSAQCQAEAIVHLMRTCKSAIIFSDTAHWVLAERTKGIADIDVTLYKIEGTLSQSCETPPSPTAFQSAESTAYIFHTSGTSSGLPKPIPQSHRAAFGVLPCFEGSQPATFTTTPLYHGGIADCFRAWTSSSMIWLFPGSVPITAKNINRSLEAAEIARSELRMSLVKYFSSVPYVLQMLADDPAGMGHLKSMEIVGVGGAPLSSSLGGKLVKDGVHLISRFGSAECGFLLSSTRNFEIDKEWQYLRLPPGLTGLILEPYEANPALSQLIVTKEWPHVAKTNRDDGSYATSDLFEPHPTIPGAWRYHSRADSQITLLTGKKFDPAPIEDDIMGSCDFVKDALIVGDGQLEPSVLVRLDEPLSREAGAERWDAVAAIIERINNASQSHARIAPSHILIFYDASPLERSSKGTILRPAANRRLQHLIQNAYRNDNDSSTKSNLSSIAEPPSDDELTGALRDVVNEVLGQGTKIIDNGADFYAHGIDSVLASRIRRAIHSSAKFGITDSELPFNVVYDCGNITK